MGLGDFACVCVGWLRALECLWSWWGACGEREKVKGGDHASPS